MNPAQIEQARTLGVEHANTEHGMGAVARDESPLSGEWAGGLTPAHLYLAIVGKAWVETDDELTAYDELADAFEDGYNTTWDTFEVSVSDHA